MTPALLGVGVAESGGEPVFPTPSSGTPSVEFGGESGAVQLEYGYLPMIRQSGKALKGEPTSIVQHANGLPKQIAIRDNRPY